MLIYATENCGSSLVQGVILFVNKKSPSPDSIPSKTEPKIHPLDLFDRFRRWFGWVVPGGQLWNRNPEQVAPNRFDD